MKTSPHHSAVSTLIVHHTLATCCTHQHSCNRTLLFFLFACELVENLLECGLAQRLFRNIQLLFVLLNTCKGVRQLLVDLRETVADLTRMPLQQLGEFEVLNEELLQQDHHAFRSPLLVQQDYHVFRRTHSWPLIAWLMIHPMSLAFPWHHRHAMRR